MDPLSFDRLEEGSGVAESPALARRLTETPPRRFRAVEGDHARGVGRRDRVVEVLRDKASFFSEWM
jgi:hypothetical protein